MAMQRDGGCVRGLKGGRYHATPSASKAGAHGLGLQPLGALELTAVGLMGAALCGALGSQSCINFLTGGVCRRVRGLRIGVSVPAWVWFCTQELAAVEILV